LRKVANLTDSLDGTNVWLPVARKNLGQSGFSGSVSANQTDFVSPGHPKIYLRHQDSRTNANLEVSNGNHVCSKKRG
jgi:hypothetical protein